MYKVTRGADSAYLLGTVHVGPAGGALEPAVQQALQGARSLALELDVRALGAANSAIARHASYAAGDSVAAHLQPASVASLVRALHAEGIPLHAVAQYKPWLLANWLSGLTLARAGLLRSEGTEFALLASAPHDAPVLSLESADSQLALFDQLNEAQAEAYLRESLQALADGSLLAQVRALLAAADSRDPAALEAVLQAATAPGGAVRNFTREAVLGQRNQAMAKAIDQLMQDKQHSLVGVGLLHLIGAQGLPALLSQRGYLVERVN